MPSDVRCPYCVLDREFTPMVNQYDGHFQCPKCGHQNRPLDPEFKCQCWKCQEIRFPGLSSRRAS
jgi:hypothetical protein